MLVCCLLKVIGNVYITWSNCDLHFLELLEFINNACILAFKLDENTISIEISNNNLMISNLTLLLFIVILVFIYRSFDLVEAVALLGEVYL